MATNDVTTLSDYLRVLRRRAWIVVLAAVLVPVVAVVLSLQQSKLFEGSAEVLLNQQNLAASLTGLSDANVYQDPARFVQTQVDLARGPVLADRVTGATGTSFDLLENSDVFGRDNSNILVFEVRAPRADVAEHLASAYARQFARYRTELDTGSLVRARAQLGERLDRLRASGDETSTAYGELLQQDQQLETLQALQASNAFVVRPATEAPQVRPRPVRAAAVGLGLGLAFGIALAFLMEALDTRVRTVDEVGTRLRLPLLARIPAPHRQLRDGGLVMLREARSPQGEAFRMLRTNLDLSTVGRAARTLLFTSAGGQEGKSTTAANVAIAVARAGHRVVLVDLDLRRPALARLFELQGGPGLTDVALERVNLDAALQHVVLSEAPVAPHLEGANGLLGGHGLLEVLVPGPLPPDPGEFVGTPVLADILGQLRARADYVILDAPPLLGVGDALLLSSKVDAIVVVVRLALARRSRLDELRRVLERMPTRKLGFVLTGVKHDDDDYSYYGGDYRPTPAAKRLSASR